MSLFVGWFVFFFITQEMFETDLDIPFFFFLNF